MIADIVRSPPFKQVFSLLLGVAIVIIIFRPYCKGGDCGIWKAPPIAEVRDSVYQIGKKCYKFNEKDNECSGDGKFIEAFRGEFTCRREVPSKVGPVRPTSGELKYVEDCRRD
jgi:hypothetical protein